MQNIIVGFSFATKANSGIYVPTLYKDKQKNHFGDDDLSTVIEIIRPRPVCRADRHIGETESYTEVRSADETRKKDEQRS